MLVFLTGATGFIGSKIIPELIASGHRVLGVTRSDAGAQMLTKAGAEPHFGTLEDPESLRAGAAKADAVIHCAFDHDFSRFVENCEKDARVIRAMGQALAGSDRPLVITSGTGVGAAAHGRLATEDVMNFEHPNPRVATEKAGVEMSAAGVKVVTVRLPQVHDTVKQGLVSPYVAIAKQNGVAAYVGEGQNRWPAAHVSAVAKLYVLAVEQGQAGERFNAVDEEGVSAREIAEVVADGLGFKAVSIPPEQAAERFGWFAPFAAMDMPASSAWTRERLGWKPSGPGLIADLRAMDYSVFG